VDLGFFGRRAGVDLHCRSGADPKLRQYDDIAALLLPDGSVMSLGGGAPGPIDNLNAERFRPDYLYDDSGQPAERLVILEAPEDVVQQSDIRFRVSDASAVDRVTMVKNGSVTRFEELSFTVDAEGYIVATPSANSNVFTPGGWMLFVLDDAGVPSHAASVLVGMGGEHFSATAESYYTLSEAAEATAENEFQLTSNAPGERGFVTTNERIDFTEDFLLSTQVNLGTGSEGLTILFQNDPWGVDIAGGGDGGLGAVGIENGFGLLFDVHQNSDETTARHTGFFAVDAETLRICHSQAPPVPRPHLRNRYGSQALMAFMKAPRQGWRPNRMPLWLMRPARCRAIFWPTMAVALTLMPATKP